jgi:ATP-dependent DNA helicase DinG
LKLPQEPAASYAKTFVWDGANKEPGAYILSPQKSLTKQYMNDFEQNGLLELKGKANYWCETHQTDCDSASVINDPGKEGDDRKVCTTCPYKEAKQRFIDNPNGVTNFAYYLNETQYAGQLSDRTMLLIDEAQNVEEQILGFADTTVRLSRVKQIGMDDIPMFYPGDTLKVIDWLNDEFVPAARTYMVHLEADVREARIEERKEDVLKLAKMLDNYDKFICRLNRFLNSKDKSDWLVYTQEENVKSGDWKQLVIKPLTATLFADDVLFSKADMVVLTSATLLNVDVFMRNLGINPRDAEVLVLPSEFPKENRPIYFWPAGCMSYKKKDATIPKLLRNIDMLMELYKGRKGIIHTQSYSLNKIVVDHLMRGPHAERVLTHNSIPGSREGVIAEHFERTDATVLVSPSMTEGLDLRDDYGRFGIICKVPYAVMDEYVKARAQRDPDWYSMLTALSMVQASGRITRSRTDKGHTFILDEDFLAFLNRNRKLLPQYWQDAIIRKAAEWIPTLRSAPAAVSNN